MPASVRRPASVYLIAMRRPPVQIVWFKRDLRVHDHAPLAEAAGLGPVLPLYVIEPGFWREPDASGRHLAFLRESLAELRAALAALGQPLVVRVGEVEAVLEDLRQQHPIGALWSHEETGNGWTYARDRRVARLGRRARHPLARTAPDRRDPPPRAPRRLGAPMGPADAPAAGARRRCS